MAATILRFGAFLDTGALRTQPLSVASTPFPDALATQGNVIEAMVRIEGLEQFRQEYGIAYALEEVMMAVVGDFVRQQLGYYLHVDLLANQQPLIVTDSTAFHQKAAFEASPGRARSIKAKPDPRRRPPTSSYKHKYTSTIHAS